MKNKVNKWKIFGYVVITWFIFSFLAVNLEELSYQTDSPLTFSESHLIVLAWMSLLLGIIMTYRLKRPIELVYGIIFFIASAVSVLVEFLIIGYFGWSYYKLEKKRLDNR
ncbi:hypothetical protein ig2599ANME_0048 [groundwater metagenome]